MFVIFVTAETGVYDVVIVNDNLDEAYEKLKEHLSKVGRVQPFVLEVMLPS